MAELMPASSAPPLLEVRDLCVSYDGRPVVNSVSFELARGRCLGVVGESGAGKSQALLALMGLLQPRARVGGEARFDGRDLLRGQATGLRGREIAMIFQDPMTALTPHLRIGEQVAEPLVVHRGLDGKAAHARAAELLDQVRLADVPRRLRQYPHELSGGMRQRVMIAMALACEPALLIADEPTTALDVSVQAQVLALLRELVDGRGMALALVTHDMGVIAALADEVAVMRHGRVVEQGPTQRLLRIPRHEYTRALLAATPRIDQPGPSPLQTARELAPAASVRNLSVRHRLQRGWLRSAREFAAVDGVSLSVAPGEALGVVGESGCGKTTLTRALMRLLPRGEGEITWAGERVDTLAGEGLRRLRAGIQIVFQDPFASLDPTMSVAGIVAEPLRALRPSLDAAGRQTLVARALEDVGLGAEFLARRSATLSGGQCQRVAIARAMVLEPKLLVCDEAVSALDVSVQAQVLALLAGIKRERGTALVFVSHNLAVVRRLCERVAVMYLGRIIEEGPTEAVFAAPRHPYTRMLLEAVPLLDPAEARRRLGMLAARGEPPSPIDRPQGCEYRGRCPFALELCAARRPGPEAVDETHQVACHRWRELPN